MSLRIVRPGLLTTVQDLGRPGRGAAGVPPGGAMDPWSLRLANRLAGNDDGDAGLEMTLQGAEICFEADAVVALAGARFEGERGGEKSLRRDAFEVHAGEHLRLGRALQGLRGYLAVRGGIDVVPVLGSRSTYLPGGFGGLEGRPLRAGDRLTCAPRAGRPVRRRFTAPIRAPGGETVVRVLLGPQQQAFSAAGASTFLSAAYRVSPRSDRMGIRLEGPRVEHAGAPDLAPEGVMHGAVQVPADGQPIVLGADRPATGGYVKIATVITADLGLLAQARPGEALRFAAVSIDDARRLWQAQEELLASALEIVAG